MGKYHQQFQILFLVQWYKKQIKERKKTKKTFFHLKILRDNL